MKIALSTHSTFARFARITSWLCVLSFIPCVSSFAQPGQPGGGAAQDANAPTTVSKKNDEAKKQIAPFFVAQPSKDLPGEALTLDRLLYGVYSPSERYRRLLAYWDLAGKNAYYNLCVQVEVYAGECAAAIEKQGSGQGEAAQLASSAREIAAHRRELARLDLTQSQRRFDASFSSNQGRQAAQARAAAKGGAATNAALYLPSTLPSTDVFETRYEEIAQTRGASAEAARLNSLLPLLYQTLQARAGQAAREFEVLVALFQSSGSSPSALLGTLDRYLEAMKKVIESAVQYNQAIASYAIQTTPSNVVGPAFLATINQKPSSGATNAAAQGRQAQQGQQNQQPPQTQRPPQGQQPPQGQNPPTPPSAPSSDAPLDLSDVSVSSSTAPSSTSIQQVGHEEAAPTADPADPADAAPAPLPAAASDVPSAPVEPAPAPTPSDSPAPTPADSSSAPEPTEGETTPSDDASAASSNVAFSSSDEYVIRGQEPAAPPAPAQEKAPTQDAAVNLTQALFAIEAPQPQNAADALYERLYTLHEALNRADTAYSSRVETSNAYWRLQGAQARLRVEEIVFRNYARLNQKFSSRASLASALEEQARVAEAKSAARLFQTELMRLMGVSLDDGAYPLAASYPFAGNEHALLERLKGQDDNADRLVGELQELLTYAGRLPAPGALLNVDAQSAGAQDEDLYLTSLEKKRESALLFIDQVVRVNLMISNLASRYAGALSADRYADLLLGRSL
ncbi:MAG: hypothetical protein ACI4NV_08360 [Thermoguttaceae bacterium]